MSFSTSSNPVNDTHLWQQMKQGSELALGKLIKKYFNLLQNYGFKFVKDEDMTLYLQQDYMTMVDFTELNNIRVLDISTLVNSA